MLGRNVLVVALPVYMIYLRVAVSGIVEAPQNDVIVPINGTGTFICTVDMPDNELGWMILFPRRNTSTLHNKVPNLEARGMNVTTSEFTTTLSIKGIPINNNTVLYCNGREGKLSEEVSFIVFEPPRSPDDIAFNVSSHGLISLSWSPAHAYFNETLAYELHKLKDDELIDIIYINKSCCEHTFEEKGCGTYTYVLYSVNEAGRSKTGSEVSITSPIDAPSEPENLIATPFINSGTVFLSWDPPINHSQCVVGYIIKSTLTESILSIPNQVNYTLSLVSEVVTCHSHTVSVAAKDTVGRIGDWSEEAKFAIAGGPLSKPTNLTFSQAITNSIVQLTWTASPDAVNCTSLYRIMPAHMKEHFPVTDASVFVTKPMDGTTGQIYGISVAAVDMYNRTGQWSDPLCFAFVEDEDCKTTSSFDTIIVNCITIKDCNTTGELQYSIVILTTLSSVTVAVVLVLFVTAVLIIRVFALNERKQRQACKRSAISQVNIDGEKDPLKQKECHED